MPASLYSRENSTNGRNAEYLAASLDELRLARRKMIDAAKSLDYSQARALHITALDLIDQLDLLVEDIEERS